MKKVALCRGLLFLAPLASVTVTAQPYSLDQESATAKPATIVPQMQGQAPSGATEPDIPLTQDKTALPDSASESGKTEPASADNNVLPASVEETAAAAPPSPPSPQPRQQTAESTPTAETATPKEAVSPVEPVSAAETAETAEPEMTMGQVIALIQQQQKDLDQQKQLLASQAQQITSLTRELDVLRAPHPQLEEQMVVKMSDRTQVPVTATETTAAKTTGVLDGPSEPPKTMEEKDTETGDAVAAAQADDPTRALLEDFKGAWRLPGTSAALAIGGYVKTSVVYNNDPLEIKDRFIVGSIPVGDDTSNIEAQSSITASQSRLNFDLREPTDYGLFRAFIEGDFAEENDTFRLRHAFGQWKKMLAGKTWSAFVDTDASPEEVDFEGLNGRINLRQSQIRITPQMGEAYEFQISMEDPNPRVQNGTGVTRMPDFVFSGRIQPHERLHVKVALLARQIRAQWRDGGVEKEYAWGTTISGRFITPQLDTRDNLLFQLNAGNGIGRYVNDLSSVGNFDGIFNPDTGELEQFDILSGYVSWQHWWGGTNQLRSNFTFGVVEVDNPDFVAGDAYKRTMRASSNLFWTPYPRIDIGGEYLWGNRKNEDGENDSATQVQLAVRYRF